jgi:hypothetical protein
MKKLNILQRPTLLIRGCSEKTFRIIRLTTLLLMVTVFNVFGVTTVSDYTNLNFDKEIDPAAIMQQYRVTGTITDQNRNPLPGVNILIEGSTNGAISDASGEFSLNVSDNNAVFIFSFIGYKTQKVPVAGKTTIDIVLVPDLANLEEVVVIGYGTVKRKDLTGSVASIRSAEIARLATNNPLQ